MKAIGYVMGACIVIAAAQAVAAALLMAVIAALAIGLLARPKETVGLVIFLTTVSFARNCPTTTIALIGMVISACLIAKFIER